MPAAGFSLNHDHSAALRTLSRLPAVRRLTRAPPVKHRKAIKTCDFPQSRLNLLPSSGGKDKGA